RQDARLRQQQEVRAEDPGDRAARADVRDARVRCAPEMEPHPRLQRGRGDTGGEVPDEEANTSERVLDVVPEDPEEEHVAADVDDSAVRSEEHTSELQSRENLVCRPLLE